MVAAEYKTNHHFVRGGSSPEVKMSESKVRLQMVNVKYNYFRLHALLNSRLTLSQTTNGLIYITQQHITLCLLATLDNS